MRSGRKIKDIDINAFRSDIQSSIISDTEKLKDCNSAMNLYNEELSRLLDLHAPIMEFLVNPQQSKWVDTKVQDARRKRRKAEQDHRRLKTGDSKKVLTKSTIKLLFQVINEVTPIIKFVVNDSLKRGVFPEPLKNALLRPVIKDENGDINSLKNYRPISNLPFISKIIEKCVHRQLSQHLEINNLHAKHQSGYRSNHSCETAMLTIYNDLLCISDVKSKVILLLLDLSAAFDTVNHERLLSKLTKQLGILGNALEWFKSYLNSRSLTVTIDRFRSKQCYLRIGVPQGSILGPILFILYTKN